MTFHISVYRIFYLQNIELFVTGVVKAGLLLIAVKFIGCCACKLNTINTLGHISQLSESDSE